jgi:hypothetical protein
MGADDDLRIPRSDAMSTSDMIEVGVGKKEEFQGERFIQNPLQLILEKGSHRGHPAVYENRALFATDEVKADAPVSEKVGRFC